MKTQLHLDGSTCVDRAIERLRLFEPKDAYVLCYSGGKDSDALKGLADEAGVSYEAHHHVTTMDAPPVIRHIRRDHPDVILDKPVHGMSFGQRVAIKGFPTRQRRWCCQEFKERHFPGRILLLGIRSAEKRASSQRAGSGSGLKRICRRTGDIAIQPIHDWTDGEVWGYIRSRGIKYCSLYDEGFSRIGCVCCPFASIREINRNRVRWPSMFEAIRRGFHRRWREHWSKGQIETVYAESGLFDEDGEPEKVPIAEYLQFVAAGPDEIFEWWLTGPGRRK